MARRKYTPDDYAPETQAAMKELLGHRGYVLFFKSDIGHAADIIEKAVVEAKKVTEEKVRAGCAAVAEAHLKNEKPRI